MPENTKSVKCGGCGEVTNEHDIQDERCDGCREVLMILKQIKMQEKASAQGVHCRKTD